MMNKQQNNNPNNNQNNNNNFFNNNPLLIFVAFSLVTIFAFKQFFLIVKQMLQTQIFKLMEVM